MSKEKFNQQQHERNLKRKKNTYTFEKLHHKPINITRV